MSENDDDARVTPISGARTPEEIGKFWDNHSLSDYWDETHEVEFELRAKRKGTVKHPRTKMRIEVVPVSKSDLESVPEAELAFYIHFGHVRNELLVIEKFLYWTMKNQTDGDVLSNVNVFQELTIIRLLAGKLWEAWLLLDNKAYSKILEALRTKVNSKTRTTLEELEAYFNDKKNMIEKIRNRFAFHYDPSFIGKQMSKVEETDQLAIYLAPNAVNCFYQFSEEIATRAMLNAVQGGDYEEAIRKLSKGVIDITVKFIGFCDGCLDHMIETYLLPGAAEFETRTVELDVLRKDQMTLPFFVE